MQGFRWTTSRNKPLIYGYHVLAYIIAYDRCAGRGADHLPKMSFVEVGDTRVSRLHCTIRLQAPRGSASTPLQAVLQDHSSNGTYIDDERVKPGVAVPLHSGSRVSLVRSVTPWVERGFTFWEGQPENAKAKITIMMFRCFQHKLGACHDRTLPSSQKQCNVMHDSLCCCNLNILWC